MNPMKKLIIAAAVLFMAGSCSKPEKHELVLDISFSSEGPFMEASPESLQYEMKQEVEDFLKSKGTDVSHISAVKLVSANFQTADSAGFSAFSACTVNLMAGGDSKAKEIAVKNPLDKTNTFTPDIAGDADLKEHFRSKEKFLVCDMTPSADRDKPFAMKGRFTFEITIKK